MLPFIKLTGGGFKRWWRRGVIIVSLLIASGVIVVGQLAVPANGHTRAPVFVKITAGEGVHQIAAELARVGLLRGTYWFRVWVWLTGHETDLVAGEYYLPPNTNILGLVQLLSGGITPTCESTLRFVEGWTIRDMQSYLAEAHVNAAEDFSVYVRSAKLYASATQALKPSLLAGKPAASTLEGYLFPDTYRVYCNASAADLVRKMMTNLDWRFPDTWRSQLSARKLTVYEALTLASIVEKEVPGDADRALVADIFLRRLAVGQGLEADSSINYVTGKSTPSVSRADLALNSPYNTYRHRGLPPGPISNPGVSAIRAVVYPQANDYWYFLTTKNGQVIYSKTYAEHQKAKLKYLR